MTVYKFNYFELSVFSNTPPLSHLINQNLQPSLMTLDYENIPIGGVRNEIIKYSIELS